MAIVTILAYARIRANASRSLGRQAAEADVIPEGMVEYVDSVASIKCNMLEGFFGRWKPYRNPKEHWEILKKSSHIVLSIDANTDRASRFHHSHF